MAEPEFVHLHLHTQYSLLDGAIRLKDLFRVAGQMNMSAVAVTDHGNLFGALDFFLHAKEAGIKPIIGCEVYVAPGSHKDREAGPSAERSNHLVLLVQNEEGYRNLNRLLTCAHLDGFYYKPRVDKELLSRHSEGLIAMSACLKGEIASKILHGDERGAAAATGPPVFGPRRKSAASIRRVTVPGPAGSRCWSWPARAGSWTAWR